MRAIVQYVVWYESLTKRAFGSSAGEKLFRAHKGLREKFSFARDARSGELVDGIRFQLQIVMTRIKCSPEVVRHRFAEA